MFKHNHINKIKGFERAFVSIARIDQDILLAIYFKILKYF